jgi:hypothetical protein
MLSGPQVSDSRFEPGDMVWILPWEAGTKAWPLGHRVIGMICGGSKKISLVGESYEVIVNGDIKLIPRDAIEKVEKDEES